MLVSGSRSITDCSVICLLYPVDNVHRRDLLARGDVSGRRMLSRWGAPLNSIPDAPQTTCIMLADAAGGAADDHFVGLRSISDDVVADQHGLTGLAIGSVSIHQASPPA